MLNTKFIHIALLATIPCVSYAQQVDFSVVSVNEESGLEFTKITSDNDYVCMPLVRRNGKNINWLTNKILDISTDGSQLAYLSVRNNSTNIFIKDIVKQGSSVQRTNRQNVMDFSYSTNGKYICFSEKSGSFNQIYQTDAKTGYVCRQITNSNKDYSPIYAHDMKNIFFARQENNGVSVWSYNIANNFLSSYTKGMNPYPLHAQSAILCTRMNAQGKGEVWKINYANNIEECILADANRSFSTPTISPNGQWILLVGSNTLSNGSFTYTNTDIFVCRIDGTQLTQLTYHAADDLSPVWSRDGKYIYFISQRGSSNATANVWRMNFIF